MRFNFTFVIAAVAGLTTLLGVSAAPMFSNNITKPAAAGIQRRAAQPAPHFVAYGDAYVPGEIGPPPVSKISGYNVFDLSFLLTTGAYDKAYEWETLTPSQRSAVKSEYANAGIKLMVSAFGSTETPTTDGIDAVSTANTMAAWVKLYDLDGIDIDYEDIEAMNAGDGRAEQWLITFTKQLRNQLPQDKYIITHAPMAPWMAPNVYGGGGYLKVHSEVGDLIDWYNVQFYNQGASEYTTCPGLLASSSAFPGTSVFEIANNGVPLDKIVIGKPASESYANNGDMDTSTLAGCVKQAKANGWNGGVMVWEHPGASSEWIKTVRGSTF